MGSWKRSKFSLYQRISTVISVFGHPEFELLTGRLQTRVFTSSFANYGLCAPTKSQDNTTQQTPLERFLSNTEKQINKKQEIIERLQNKENEILAKLERVKSDPRDGNICRNCHLRLGHSARTYQFGRCTSVFKCGEEKYHSGEINMKELRNQIKKNESELRKLRSELDNKGMALATQEEG